jgi:hypothetical protein
VKVRFQADWDLNGDIVTGVLRREPAIDFQTAFAADLAGVDDPEVLARSAAAGRVLVTHDRRSMPLHFGIFLVSHASPGLLIVPQDLPVRAVIEDRILIWSCTEAAEWQNILDYLPM